MSELHLYDFGIFIDLMPDEEEKAILENNIQMAIQQKSLDVDDAIDIRQVKNLKMANQLIKLKKKNKIKRDQQVQQQNIEAQGKSQQETAQAAAQAEMQKNEAKMKGDMEMENMKAEMKIKFMKAEAEMKRELMDHEFDINMKLRQMDNESSKNKDSAKDDRADERERIKASQQSNLISQKKNETEPKNFESSGNDSLGNGMGVAGLTGN